MFCLKLNKYKTHTERSSVGTNIKPSNEKNKIGNY